MEKFKSWLHQKTISDDSKVFKGDLDQARTIAEREEPEREPRADTIRGGAAIVRALSKARARLEQDDTRRRHEEDAEPGGEYEEVVWDGLRRRRTPSPRPLPHESQPRQLSSAKVFQHRVEDEDPLSEAVNEPLDEWESTAENDSGRETPGIPRASPNETEASIPNSATGVDGRNLAYEDMVKPQLEIIRRTQQIREHRDELLVKRGETFMQAGATVKYSEADAPAPAQQTGTSGNVTRAEQFEDEKQSIIKSCFSKQNHKGTTLETYITHVQITEYPGYEASPPPPDRVRLGKKQRAVILSVRHSGRVRMHKARDNGNGTFSIGRSWNLEELTGIGTYANSDTRPQHVRECGFVVDAPKPYYWQASSQKEKDFFVHSLVKVYGKYMNAAPALRGFSAQEKSALQSTVALGERSMGKRVPSSDNGTKYDEQTALLGASSAQSRLSPVHQPSTKLSYLQLDFANFETRFLTILPKEYANHSESIFCQLVHGSLIDAFAYVALSYCWGDHEVTSPIFVDGCAVYVTTNLEAALRQLRATGERRVWIDAVCINQANSYERSYQVSLMGKIFSRAEKVIAWLGDAGDDSEQCMRLLSKLGTRQGSEEPPALQSEATQAAQRLLARPYWRRVWIVQEMAKASAVEIWCGSEQLSWPEFLLGVTEWNSAERSRLDTSDLDNLQHFCREERLSTRGLARMLLSSAILRTYKCNATDPRDKVYALLALSRDGPEVVPIPNYRQAPDQVLEKAFERMIVTQGQTALLMLAGKRQNVLESPSWLPIWNGQQRPSLPPWIQVSVDRERAVGDLGPEVERFGPQLRIRAVLQEFIVEFMEQESDFADTETIPTSLRAPDVANVLREVCGTLMTWQDSLAPPQASVVADRARIAAAFWFATSEYQGEHPSLMTLSRWYAEHKHMMLHGHSLYTWVAKEKEFLGNARYRNITQHSLGNEWSKSVLIQLESELKMLEMYDMKIVRTTKEWRCVYKEAQAGDDIVRLEGCALPVVLRPEADGRYSVVGEVLARTAEKEHDKEPKANDWKTITLI